MNKTDLKASLKGYFIKIEAELFKADVIKLGIFSWIGYQVGLITLPRVSTLHELASKGMLDPDNKTKTLLELCGTVGYQAHPMLTKVYNELKNNSEVTSSTVLAKLSFRKNGHESSQLRSNSSTFVGDNTGSVVRYGTGSVVRYGTGSVIGDGTGSFVIKEDASNNQNKSNKNMANILASFDEAEVVPNKSLKTIPADDILTTIARGNKMKADLRTTVHNEAPVVSNDTSEKQVCTKMFTKS